MNNPNASVLLFELSCLSKTWNTVLFLFASSYCLCNFRSDLGQVILKMLKDAKIDVEKMKEEKLLW